MGHYFYHGTKDQAGKEGVLISCAVGDKADVLIAQPAGRKKQLVLESLKPASGDLSKYVASDLKYYWGKDPYSYGAYAKYGIGYWSKIMPTLLNPFRSVHFAGEHLPDWQGFMEGAVNSGEDALGQFLYFYFQRLKCGE